MREALDFIKQYNETTKKVAEDGKNRIYNQNFEYEIKDNKKVLIIKTDKK